jgi:HK97 family phage portal protein
MTALRALFESRASLEIPTTPLTSTALVDWLGGVRLDSGVTVSERTAPQMAAVWRCVWLLSHVPASLPLHTYQRGTRNRTEGLPADPHPELTWCELARLWYAHRATWGNSYTQKLHNRAGQLKELWPISPDRVRVERIKPSDGNPGGKLFTVIDDWGVTHTRTSRDILHIPGWGYDGITGVSPVRYAAQAIGLGIASEKSAAKVFGRGAQLSGVLQTEQRLEQPQADALKDRWRAKLAGVDNHHDIAVLDSGASFQPISMPYRDAQFLESRVFSVEEIGRFFGIPHYLLGLTQKSTSWGTGLEQQALGWVVFDLAPAWLTPTEQRVTKELLPARDEAKYAVQGLLRGDSKARAEFYQTLWGLGALSPDEIRDLEDRPPLPDGQGTGYFQPLNYQPLGTTPDDDPPPQPDEEDDDDPDSDDDDD